ncbi:SGNH/GDSL hydrolase family protein [Hydrogenophaga sp. MI9]|uniref:SGNH/GDSL hydrolase family protein n=1 Tax=Hydrogenophaga sp. MI9 TaxID=3453719 RepID=UPI003EEA84D1
MNYFHDPRVMQDQYVTASILAIGDSWFWYPAFGGSLVNHLGPMVAPKSHNILAIGNNGAEVADFTVGRYKNHVRQAIRLYGDALSAVFVSGGGNDFAGYGDLRPLLNLDCSAATTPEQCFWTGTSGLADFMSSINNHYRNLIGQIWTRTGPDCHIVVHTYDYAIPSGIGFGGSSHAWLKSALDAAKVPPALQAECMRHMVDEFYRQLKSIEATDPGHIHVVDSRGVLKPHLWANELHPTSKGFEIVAEMSWRPVLETAGLA